MVHYRVLRPLGHGPDGPVEEVLPDHLGAEPLARRRLAVPAGTARRHLRDSVEALARLGHPAIATVVDVVDVDDDHVEVVRTLGTDGTLADRLGAGSLSPAEAETVIATLADALRAAHAVGVAHGNVTATNVLCRDGEVLLADFGASAARGGRADGFTSDLEQLARLADDLASVVAPEPPVPPPAPALPHWTERPSTARPAAVAPAVGALPSPAERALAGALAFGLGTAIGVTFVLVEAVTGRA